MKNSYFSYLIAVVRVGVGLFVVGEVTVGLALEFGYFFGFGVCFFFLVERKSFGVMKRRRRRGRRRRWRLIHVICGGVRGVELIGVVAVQLVGVVVVEKDVGKVVARRRRSFVVEYELETLEKVLHEYFDEARKVLQVKIGDGGVVVEQYVKRV